MGGGDRILLEDDDFTTEDTFDQPLPTQATLIGQLLALFGQPRSPPASAFYGVSVDDDDSTNDLNWAFVPETQCQTVLRADFLGQQPPFDEATVCDTINIYQMAAELEVNTMADFRNENLGFLFQARVNCFGDDCCVGIDVVVGGDTFGGETDLERLVMCGAKPDPLLDGLVQLYGFDNGWRDFPEDDPILFAAAAAAHSPNTKHDDWAPRHGHSDNGFSTLNVFGAHSFDTAEIVQTNDAIEPNDNYENVQIEFSPQLLRNLYGLCGLAVCAIAICVCMGCRKSR